jgi:hypothetical protein
LEILETYCLRAILKEILKRVGLFLGFKAFPSRKFEEKVSLFPNFSLRGNLMFLLLRLSYWCSRLELAEARRLISEAGFRPYFRKVKGKAYITLKRGSREVSVGPPSPDVWDSLQSEWSIAMYGSKNTAASLQGQAPKPRLDALDASIVFEWLEAGHDPAWIVKETGLHPDVVEEATMRYLQLKKLNPRAIAELTETIEKALKGIVIPLAEGIGLSAEFRQGVLPQLRRESLHIGMGCITAGEGEGFGER